MILQKIFLYLFLYKDYIYPLHLPPTPGELDLKKIEFTQSEDTLTHTSCSFFGRMVFRRIFSTTGANSI